MLELLLSQWRIILLGIVVTWAAVVTHLYIGERDAFNSFKAEQKALADAAEQRGVEVANGINKGWADALPGVRSNAISVYCRTHLCGVQPVPGAAGGSTPSAEGSDGARQESSTTSTCAIDRRFIEDAAEDALKIKSWQEWATRNNLPIQ
jgi:hypothetical protein